MSDVGRDDVAERMYEAAVEKQRARFRALVEHAPSVMATLDTTGRFKFLSPSLEDVFGYRPEALVGENAFEYIHPSDRERVQRLFERGLEEPGRVLTAEYRFRHAEGQWLQVESRGHNRLHDPAVEGFVVNTRDVTAERRATAKLRRERNFNRQLLESAPHPMVVVDHKSVVRRVNEVARTQLGLTTDQMIDLDHDSGGGAVFDADGEPLAESETVCGRVRATGGPVHDQTLQFVSPNDERFRVEASGSPLVVDSDVTHVVISIESVERL